jgi:hypothetical protein
MEGKKMQYVHNVMISMPGSSLTVASLCTYHCKTKDHKEYVVGGTHYGVSEFFVDHDSTLCFSMVLFQFPFLHRFIHGATPTLLILVLLLLLRIMVYSTLTMCAWSPLLRFR